jgi:hypothetical protein
VVALDAAAIHYDQLMSFRVEGAVALATINLLLTAAGCFTLSDTLLFCVLRSSPSVAR